MMAMVNRWLVPGWRQSWTWFSVHAHIIGTTGAGLLLLTPSMPAEVQALVPLKWRAIAIGVWLVAGLLARLKKQGS